ncbi:MULTISPECIES: hypothetical protein [Hyphobacterium]|uniref:Phosphatidate cytidylyltransferase n=1 Tax=Hyphobacterium vulgare TaxID=1736751 RepID=A0ABV6ZXP8_9PROT
MRVLRDFALTALIAGAGLWLFLGPGAVPFAMLAGTLVAWDNARRRQLRASGFSIR